MVEFLLSHYSLFTHILEFLAAFTGFLFYKKYKNTPVKYFIWFLLVVAICDLLGIYAYQVRPDGALSFLIGTKIQKNIWWSTLYWSVGAILFYAFYFFKILKNSLFKKATKVLAIVFFVFSIFYIGFYWENFFNQFFKLIKLLGAIIIFICTIFYFIETLTGDKILVFYKSINFYISATIFIWWLVITPLTFYDIYYFYEIGKAHYDQNFAMIRKQIYLFANIFMYLTFTFALIWCKPEND